MQEILTLYDFLLLPVYLLLFYWIVRRKSKKYAAAGLKKIFIAAFIVRMAGSVGYSLLIQYYYGYGDSFGFYLGGNVITDMIQQDIAAVKYLFYPAKDIVAAAKAMGFEDDIPVTMPIDSNALVMRISAVLSFFTFNKYLLISICFGFFSFIGIWKLFYVFYLLNNKRNVMVLAFFVLFLPSLWFWGSGLLKEPLCIGALGIIMYLFYKNFIEKKLSKREILIMIAMLFILTVVKSYITILLFVCFFMILIYKAIERIKNILFRIIVTVFVLFTLITTLVNIDESTYVQYFVDNSLSQIKVMQQSYQNLQEQDEVGSKGSFLIEMDTSPGSILANAPAVIATCLFRPFVWESKKVIIFFTSLEALLTLVATLYVLLKTKVFYFFKYSLGSPFLFFCLVFSLLFALVIGYTTFNFGTMARYKIMFLPFYYFLLIQVYSRYRLHHSA